MKNITDETIIDSIVTNGGKTADIDFVTKEDIAALGKKAAQRSAKMNTVFHSWDITPVNSPNELTSSNVNFHPSERELRDGSYKLPKAVGTKKVYLMSFKKLNMRRMTEVMKEYGKKPCENAPNYLLGLLQQVPASEMPAEFENKNIVAGGVQHIFKKWRAGQNYNCLLCAFSKNDSANRDGNPDNRCLYLVLAGIEWGSKWLMLAEDL